MACRICGSGSARELGSLQPEASYRCSVFECAECGCRFTEHDAGAYERLHGAKTSTYGSHAVLADACHDAYRVGDAPRLRALLCATPKYRFVIEALDDLPAGARVLELGCSHGYLTAHFLLRELDATGVDVSEAAVEHARALFGQHFRTADEDAALGAKDRGGYDAIVHVGTIGCVADPIAMTRESLVRLRPGGRLVFNSPNVQACALPGQLWVDGTWPPDLVTLFAPRFWRERFADLASAQVQVERRSVLRSLEHTLMRRAGLRWTPRPPEAPRPGNGGQATGVDADSARPQRPLQRAGARARRWLGAAIDGLPLPVARTPSDFGVHVTLTRHTRDGQPR